MLSSPAGSRCGKCRYSSSYIRHTLNRNDDPANVWSGRLRLPRGVRADSAKTMNPEHISELQQQQRFRAIFSRDFHFPDIADYAVSVQFIQSLNQK